MIVINTTIPLLRIFDYQKATEFYVDWLGFEIEWEHRFEPGLPVYMQVSRPGLTLHLTEHHGDCCPGAKVFVRCTGLRDYHRALTEKQYRYNRPGVEPAFWGGIYMEVVDPFGNKLLFSEADAT